MGGKDAPAPPAPVDPTVMANAQADANSRTAREQQQLNMVGTSGPGGSVSYVADPSQPSGYRQVTSFSPGQQGLYDLGVAAQTGALGIANDQIGRIGTALGRDLTAPELQYDIGPTDFTADREAITDAVYGRARSRLDPMWGQAEDRLDTKLSNQGLGQNSSAAITAREGFGRSRNDAYDQALTSAILAGADEQNTLFNQSLAQGNFRNATSQQDFGNQALARSQPINDFAALLGTGDIMMPQQYSGPVTGVAPTDVMGAYGLNAQQQNNNYSAQMQNRSANNQALSNLAGAGLKIAPFIMSDRRAKKNITRVGERSDGLGLYTFRYRAEHENAPLRYGVMADEVAEKYPEAVRAIDGLLHVNYEMI